jgi:catalase
LFDSNGRGTRLSKAVVFEAGRVPIIGRFSLAGGNPYVADGRGMVRGLGLLFKLPDGQEWRTAMIDTAVFGVHIPQAFYDKASGCNRSLQNMGSMHSPDWG